MPKKFYDRVDFNQNEIDNTVFEHIADFPAQSRQGRIIYHTGLREVFYCKNGTENGYDTTLKGNWIGLDKIDISRMVNDNIEKGKIIVTDGSGGYDHEDCDGGTL